MACTDMAIRLEVGGLATGSSASKKSRSLELLLFLHTLVGAAVLQRTNECSSSGRGRCAMLPPSELCTRTWCGSAQLKWRSQQPQGRAGVAALAHVDALGTSSGILIVFRYARPKERFGTERAGEIAKRDRTLRPART